jgi:protein TonB
VDWRGLLNSGLLKHKAYPLSARRMRQEGTVVVHAAFAADGTLVECAVADSSGFATLDAAALQLVRTAAHAALASATPGDRVTLRIPIVYELKDT